MGDALPYGWDEAEVDGETYFIDHINQKTHWLHPRLLLEEMREEFVSREAAVQAKAQTNRDTIAEHREKRARLEAALGAAGDDEEVESLNDRIARMDEVIGAELAKLSEIVAENDQLKADIRELKRSFGLAEWVTDNSGANAKLFDAGDIEDLYALGGKGGTMTKTLPRKLDTATKEMLAGGVSK